MLSVFPVTEEASLVMITYIYSSLVKICFCRGKRGKEKYVKKFSSKFICTQLLWVNTSSLKKKSKEMLIYYVDRYISKLITSIYLWNNTVSAIWNFWPPQTSIIKVHFFGLKLILRMLAPQGLEFFACFEYYNFSTPKIYIYIYDSQ